MKIAPIFDCGSALYPQINDEMIKKVMSSKTEMEARVYDMPTSAILVEGKRANYFKLITSLKYNGCNEAIKRIIPKINLDKINFLIDESEQISELQKEFLKKILKLRKEKILDYAFKKIS